MFYHKETNTYIDPLRDIGFTLGSNQYPAGWLNVSSKKDKEDIGLVDVVTEGSWGDENYFFNYEQLTGNIRHLFSVPKPQEMIDLVVKSQIETLLTKVRSDRELLLNRLSGIAVAAYITDDTKIISAYKKIRQSLLDITKDLPETIDGVKATIVERYKAIVVTAITEAPSLESAFNSLDL
jgi:hypothetical protein